MLSFVPLEVDDSADPVIVVSIRGKLDERDVATLIGLGTRYVARERPYAMVYVPKQLAVPSFQDLKLLLRWMKEHEAELDRWFRAMVLVSDSPVLRGTLRGILSLGQLRTPHHLTATLEEGVTWAENTLALRASVRT